MPALRTRDTPSQSLEVIADTIQQPSLAIVSPTPRANSFPLNHTCPYSSSSPFEPDLGKLTLSTDLTLVRTTSPISPSDTSPSSSCSPMFPTTQSTIPTSTSTFPTSPASSHKRRKSSICTDLERRPKKGDEDYIKRPENAFILFRRKCCEDRQAAMEETALDGSTKKQRQADLSKTISQQWKSLSAEDRLYWEELAKEKKKEHELLYPNYVYRPQRSKDRKGKKGKRGEDGEETTISFVLPFCPPVAGKNHCRSSSAPTPPPCQTIQVPSLYTSCPTSPSMMINRRAAHPDHGSRLTSRFDPVVSNTALSQHPYSPSDVYPAGGLYPGMLETPHPLSIQSDMSMNHSVHQMASPASSVSSVGPPSPASATFSPINGLPGDFSYPVVACDELGSQMDGSFCGATMDNMQLGYLPCSWETAGAWGNHSQMLTGDEFDMGSIPPVEIGLAGCGDEMLPSATLGIGYTSGPYDPMVIPEASYATDPQSQPDTFEQLFNFESMLAAHHGF